MLFITPLFFSSVYSIAYSLCDDNNYIYAGESITTKLVIGPSQAVTINGEVKGISVQGTITIVNGCSVHYYSYL